MLPANHPPCAKLHLATSAAQANPAPSTPAPATNVGPSNKTSDAVILKTLTHANPAPAAHQHLVIPALTTPATPLETLSTLATLLQTASTTTAAMAAVSTVSS